MRRLITILLSAALVIVLLSGSALAGPSYWTPGFHSPPDPAEIVSDWDTPAQGTAPSTPWIVGYPYDKVPDQAYTGVK